MKWIGGAGYRKVNLLSKEELNNELSALLKQLSEKSITLEVLGDYDNETIYRFLTEELPQLDIEQPGKPELAQHFCYEDFHPNHEMDISQRCTEFITQWLRGKINEYSWELAETFVHPDSRTFSKKTLLKKVNSIFSAFESYVDGKYHIDQVMYEWDEQSLSGKGFARGAIRYVAGIKCGGGTTCQGPFEFYLEYREGWWSIYYFVFPGFSWNDQWPD